MGFVVTCHDITERHELEQQLTHQAFHDALTGLANRALFRDRLGHAMAAGRGAGGYGVLFIDLDDFKTVNDSLGHAAGDALLREMTDAAAGCLRDGDTAARLGGDEFAVLLEDVDDDSDCVDDRRAGCIEALSEPFDIGGTEVTTGASIGIALGPGRPGDARGPDAQRRPRAVRREERGQEPLRRVRADDARGGAGAALADERPASRHRARRARRALPAARRPASRADDRSASRRWCAGSTPSAGCCCPASSSRSPRRPG